MTLRALPILACVAFSLSAFSAESPAGRAVSVAGKVLVRNELNRDLGTSFLKAGDNLAPGSILNTGSTGAAKILMSDKTIIDLGPSTLFKVNEYKANGGGPTRQVEVGLDYGQIRTSVNQPVKDPGKFTIRTKAATMGVRGTEFVVNATMPMQGETNVAPTTQVTVMHGKVDVQDLGATAPAMQVQGGMQINTGAGAPQMTKLEAPAIANIQREATQKDMTFTQAVSVETSNTSSSSNSGRGEGGGEGPHRGGNQTLGDIAQTMSNAVNAEGGVSVHDVNLPGMFGGMVIPNRPIDYLNGRPASVKVKFCPAGGNC